jgi:hypothetical protein
MYWSDVLDGIFRADLTGDNVQPLLSGAFPTSIALDLVNDKIYWVSLNTSSIFRADLDGSDEELVTNTSVTGLAGIAVHPGQGKVYWSNDGGGIFRANFNGTNVEPLVDGAFVNGGRSLKLDIGAGKMYWTGESSLSRANLDGTVIEPIYTGSFPGNHIALVLLNPNLVHVDFGFAGVENGTETHPFNTLQEALPVVADGGTIRFVGNSSDTQSPETLTINQDVTLNSVGGSVRIGVAGSRNATRGFVAP